MRGFRKYYDIAVFRDGEWAERGEITLEAAAKLIGVCNMTALRMLRRGETQRSKSVKNTGSLARVTRRQWQLRRVCLLSTWLAHPRRCLRQRCPREPHIQEYVDYITNAWRRQFPRV